MTGEVMIECEGLTKRFGHFKPEVGWAWRNALGPLV
jgi:hypothetical protein